LGHLKLAVRFNLTAGGIVIVTAKKKSQMQPHNHAQTKVSGHGKAADSSAGFAFPKTSRILKHSTFQSVYEGGRRHFSPNMTFFYMLQPVSEGKVGAQIGITVGRALGGAVDRNRLKRRFRDLVRHNLGTLNNALADRSLSAEVVINPKKAALSADHEVLRAEIERGFSVIASAKLVPPSVNPEPKARRKESKAKA
jgi:ribonuclease P protein component